MSSTRASPRSPLKKGNVLNWAWTCSGVNAEHMHVALKSRSAAGGKKDSKEKFSPSALILQIGLLGLKG